jgi:predicted Rossmann fold flavoprotein
VASDEVLDLAVIGGGASGFFTALRYAELAPGKRVAIFEKGGVFLQKVRISGGGRCNVTHACFDPGELAKSYPRGARELRAAFHRWQPRDTLEWFAARGVTLKTEADGRMFPATDSSETIINCFLSEAREAGIPLLQQHALTAVARADGGEFLLTFEKHAVPVRARAVCIATGSLKGSTLLDSLRALGQKLEPLVPSLFAFNVDDARLAGLAGVAHPRVGVRREGGRTAQHGPLLITHRGVSGPAILRLSAWDAREMAAANHHFGFLVDWLPDLTEEAVQALLLESRAVHGAKLVRNVAIAPIPRRLWENLVSGCGIDAAVTWAQLGKPAARALLGALKASRFEAAGKTTNKDEFVTCGGIGRATVDFRTMESRVTPGMYFVGEALDVDGITGGFNFQAAWTTAHIAAAALAGCHG